ncbi:MAG: YbaY family lipoprotein [Actinomycetota bacterium]
MMRIRIVSPDSRPEDAGCSVTVQVRDTSLADVVHPVVAEARALFPDDVGVPFDVMIELPTERTHGHHYGVWAHLDHTGDGAIGAGDLITTQSFPVDLSRDDFVEIRLSRV